MEITIGEVLVLSGMIEKLQVMKDEDGNSKGRSMPFRVKHRLIKAQDKLQKELGPYERERVELIKKYGEPMEDNPQASKVKDENLQEFYDELGKVLATTTIVNLDYCKLTEEDIDAIEGDVDSDDASIRAFQKYMVVEE